MHIIFYKLAKKIWSLLNLIFVEELIILNINYTFWYKKQSILLIPTSKNKNNDLFQITIFLIQVTQQGFSWWGHSHLIMIYTKEFHWFWVCKIAVSLTLGKWRRHSWRSAWMSLLKLKILSHCLIWQVFPRNRIIFQYLFMSPCRFYPKISPQKHLLR